MGQPDRLSGCLPRAVRFFVVRPRVYAHLLECRQGAGQKEDLYPGVARTPCVRNPTHGFLWPDGIYHLNCVSNKTDNRSVGRRPFIRPGTGRWVNFRDNPFPVSGNECTKLYFSTWTV